MKRLSGLVLVLLVACGGSLPDPSTPAPSDAPAPLPASSVSSTTPPPARPTSGVEGITIEIPPGFVALTPDKVEAFVHAALVQAPKATITAQGVEEVAGDESRSSHLFLSRAQVPSGETFLHGTVKEQLSMATARLELSQRLTGKDVDHFDSKVGPRSSEFRLHVRGDATAAGGLFMAGRFFFDRQHQLMTLMSLCLGADHPERCDALLDQVRYDVGDALPAEEVLGSPLKGIELGGFRGGSTAEEFQSTCAKLGMKKTPIPAGLIPAEHDPAESLVACAGKDPTFPYGPLGVAYALLANGKAVSFVFELAVPEEQLTRSLSSQFPPPVVNTDGLFFAQPDAKLYQPMALGMTHSTGPQTNGQLTVITRLAFDRHYAAPAP